MQNPHIDIGTYGIWTGALDMVPSAVAGEATAELDELGYGRSGSPDGVPGALRARRADGRVRRGSRSRTGIVNRYGRDPLAANAAMQTLNEAFPGRFLLGLGVSHEHLVAWVRKHDYSRPYSGMVEYLDAMAKARFFAPRGEPPAQMVLAAGPHARARRRAASGRPPGLRAARAHRDRREAMGPEPLLAVEQMVVLDTDPATARETARQHMAVYLSAPNYTNNLARLGFGPEDVADGGSDRLVDAIVVHGELDDALGRIRSHLDAGADHVCVQVLHPDMAHLPGRSGESSPPRTGADGLTASCLAEPHRSGATSGVSPMRSGDPVVSGRIRGFACRSVPGAAGDLGVSWVGGSLRSTSMLRRRGRGDSSAPKRFFHARLIHSAVATIPMMLKTAMTRRTPARPAASGCELMFTRRVTWPSSPALGVPSLAVVVVRSTSPRSTSID